MIAAKLAVVEQTELVKKYATELEAKVEEQTRELKIANDELEYLASSSRNNLLAGRRRHQPGVKMAKLPLARATNRPLAKTSDSTLANRFPRLTTRLVQLTVPS